MTASARPSLSAITSNFERRSVDRTQVYRQKDLPPAANYGRVVGVRRHGSSWLKASLELQPTPSRAASGLACQRPVDETRMVRSVWTRARSGVLA